MTEKEAAMFYVEDQDKNRHTFHSEKYARGYLKATYHEKLWEIENNPERYEIRDRKCLDNEFKISVKDKSRLYFLRRAADVRNLVFTCRLGRMVEGNLDTVS